MVHKVVLSSKKEVLLREMKIKYQNLALKAIGQRGGDNNMLTDSLMQQELLKILIVQVDGKPVDSKVLEQLDEVFAYAEYMQLLQVVNKISGGNELGEFQTEIVPIGSN